MKRILLILGISILLFSCDKDPVIFTLSVTVTPEGSGTVNTMSGSFEEGSEVVLTVTPSPEYLFKNWSGSITGDTQTIVVVMSSNKLITANFEKKKYPLSTTIEGEGTVEEVVKVQGRTTDYNSGTVVELTAKPSPEWIFKEWKGDITSTENPTQITINKSKSVVCVFEKRKYPLTITIEGEGTVTEQLITSKVTSEYPSGSKVKLTAVPKEGWKFVNWSGDVTSNENPIQITVDKIKNVTVKFIPIVKKNYLKTSYELSNYDEWLSSDDLISDGNPHSDPNPFMVMQTCQIDINGDGLEDLFTYDSYPLDREITNPPPRVFINNGLTLNEVSWEGPNIRMPHGVKLLVGDFNNDSLPDIFSLVAIDPPFGLFPDLKDYNNILFNSPTGFNSIKEFDDQRGFWYTGCSGDIDNDGDLDIIMINFHFGANGVTSKILWNDGKGNFTYGLSGFSNISPIGSAELYDINNDGFLDLIIEYIQTTPTRIPNIIVMWGNGKDFELTNSTTFLLNGNLYLMDIDFTDINNDGIAEIIISGTDETNGLKYFISLYRSDDNGKTFIDKTDQYFDVINFPRFGHMTLRDIDKNGNLDIFTSDKRDNIRWEWNGSKFIKK